MWKRFDPSTMPTSGQVLVTSDDLDGADCDHRYCDIELICLPVLDDGRTLNQNSGNYNRANTWKWWMPVPPREFERE